MRVVLISRRQPHDGTASYTRMLEGYWRSRRATVEVIHVGDPTGAGPHDHVMPVSWSGSSFSLPAPGARRRLRLLLGLLGADLVHALLPASPLDFALPGLCARLGVPLLGTFLAGWCGYRTLSGVASQMLHRLYAPAVTRYDRMIVFGEAQRQAFISRGVPGFRLAAMHPGVDTLAFSPIRRPPRFDEPVRLTFAGRLTRTSGVAEVAAAFVRAAQPNLLLTIAGEGPLAGTLQARYSGHPAIEWRQSVSEEGARRALWLETDVVIVPSHREALNGGLLEAMACGCLPVVTDVGAHREVVGERGCILAPDRLVDNLADTFSHLMTHSGRIGGLGLKARARIVEAYARPEQMQRFDALVDGLIRGGPIPP